MFGSQVLVENWLRHGHFVGGFDDAFDKSEKWFFEVEELQNGVVEVVNEGQCVQLVNGRVDVEVVEVKRKSGKAHFDVLDDQL